MNGAWLVGGGTAYFALAYRLYGGFLNRLFGVKADRPTPAHVQRDGVDYVPTPWPVLFGHHFASIAGAGPIVGPVLAAVYGWGPVALWVLVGCVFVGAMHDFAALFVSVRDEGRSIGHVIERQIGYTGRQIFLLFAWAALVLIVAIFAMLVARTFVATPAVATATLRFIGMAPVFGWLVYGGRLRILSGSLIFVPLLFLGVWAGTRWPLDLTVLAGCSPEQARRVWLVVLFVYAFVASTIPVWLLLQPRDYLNSYLLYVMIILGFAGIVAVRPVFALPAFAGWRPGAAGSVGSGLFPLLFVTVACGACSGFHALVASGTTSKQLASERHIRVIGYGAMLVEGVLALMALTTVAVLTREGYLARLAANGPVTTFAMGLAAFTRELGVPAHVGTTFIALSISAFMLTTLDTATRLTRFTWQELFLPPAGDERRYRFHGLLANRYSATLVAVAASGYLAFSGQADRIWPVFGASNQLLAALTLLAVSLVLRQQGRRRLLVALVPMVFMMLVCLWALCRLLADQWYLPQRNWMLLGATVFLVIMAAALMVQAVHVVRARAGK